MGKDKQFQTSFFILLLISVLSVYAQDNIELQTDLFNDYEITGGKFKYFQVTIANTNFTGSQDLIVSVLPFNDQSDPDLFISKTNKKPNSVENSDWICSSYGKDTCSVHKSKISFQDTFYIGVRCIENCKFFIKATVSDEIPLTPGEEVQLYFERKETKIFNFYVPKEVDNKYPIESVTIIAAPFLPTQNELMLSVSTQKNSLPSSNVNSGVPAWTKGQVILLTSNSEDKHNWCTDCYMTIMVDVADEGRYYVMAKTNMAQPKLYEGKKLDDALYHNHTQCYSYYVKQAQAEVQIKYQMFSGIIVMTVKPKGVNHDNFTFVDSSLRSTVLTLTPSQRSKQVTGQYEICVKAALTSSYSIIVHEELYNDQYKLIEDGFNQRDEIYGQETKVYIYKVPPLRYEGEDIVLEFQIQSRSGSTPNIGVQVCKSVDQLDQCAKDALKVQQPTSQVQVGQKSGFVFGQTIMSNMKAVAYDHNENECADIYNNECYYTILVQGTGKHDSELSEYTLAVFHEQNNHQILLENTAQHDYIDPSQHPFRYYRFQLIDKPSNIQSITFKLNTLHGDADLYISKQSEYPTKTSHDKGSVLGRSDLITYDRETDGVDKMKGAFYIGVYGFQYSTYTLTATVKRKSKGQLAVDIYQAAGELEEGVPVMDGIYSIYGERLYKVKFNMVEGYEKTANIQLTAIDGQFVIFASWSGKPNETSYDYKSESNSIKIDPTDKSFSRTGTLFISVKPHYTLLQIMHSSIKYKFTIVYTSEEQYIYLQSKAPQSIHQNRKEIKYFRHFVSSANTDISIGMTVKSGSPSMFISITPQSTMWPSSTQYDYSSLTSNQMQQGKMIQIKSYQLMQHNAASCKDAGLTSLEPCAIYISVQCDNQVDCAYQMMINYENGESQVISIGHPTYGEIKEGNYNYYYTIINRDSEVKDIYAVLTSLSGNTDLYFGFQDFSESKLVSSWKIPNKSIYSKKSSELLAADVLTINKEDIEDNCFLSQESNECALIFGVYGYSDKGSMGASNEVYNVFKYSIVVYQDIINMYSNSPQTNQVEEGQYQYYMFHANCDQCSILIAVSTYSAGDPDLYINYGDTRLPTKLDHDISRTTFKSEIVELNLQNMDFFRSKNIKSMRGPYIIGVYGSATSTYTISITAESYPIALISEGLSFKMNQDAYEIAYYQWYNWQDKDIKLVIDVKLGSVDAYISTYDPNNKEQNLVERLPKSKKIANWVLSGVSSTSSTYEKEKLIVQKDRDYCQACVYIVGIATHEKQADYTVTLSTLNADFKNSQILKLGQTQRDHLNKNERVKFFKFMIDDLSELQISFKVIRGRAEGLLGFSENVNDSFRKFTKSGTMVISRSDKNLKTKKMYYFAVYQIDSKDNDDVEFSLFITQRKSIIHLQDGVAQHLTFKGKEDITKLLTIGVPKGDSLIMFQLKSKTPDFYPKLYYQFYTDINEQMRSKNITFPPNGSPGFSSYKKWDPKLNIMNYHFYQKGVTSPGAGLAITVFDYQMERKDSDNAEIIITVSYSSEQRLLMKNTYMGTLFNDEQFRLYKVDHSDLAGRGSLLIEYSDCLGQSNLKFVEGPDQINSTLKQFSLVTSEGQGKKSYYLPLPRDKSLYVMVYSNEGIQEFNRSDFLIKAHITDKKFIKSEEFLLPDQGQLLFQFSNANSFNLTWKAPRSAVPYDQPSPVHVKYHILATLNEHAQLESICAIRKEIIELFGYSDFGTDNTYYYFQNGQPGSTYYFNVIAEIQGEAGDEKELLAYKPVEIYIPKSNSLLTGLALWLFIIVAVILSVTALYYYRQNKETSQQLEFEMADVRNVASIYNTSQKMELQTKQREEKFQKLNQSDGIDEPTQYK